LEGQVRWPDVSDAKRLKALEDENTKLKKLLAELSAIRIRRYRPTMLTPRAGLRGRAGRQKAGKSLEAGARTKS
jgi:hypothetical protein